MNRTPRHVFPVSILLTLLITAFPAFGGVHADAPPGTAQFDFLEGQHVCDGRQLTADGTYFPFTGVWTGGYVLDGYAFADEFRVLGTDGNPAFFGRNFRTFDAESQSWTIKWYEVVSGTWHDLRGGKEDGTMVITTEGRDQVGEYQSRVTFSGFHPEGFAWRDDRSYDEARGRGLETGLDAGSALRRGLETDMHRLRFRSRVNGQVAT